MHQVQSEPDYKIYDLIINDIKKVFIFRCEMYKQNIIHLLISTTIYTKNFYSIKESKKEKKKQKKS